LSLVWASIISNGCAKWQASKPQSPPAASLSAAVVEVQTVQLQTLPLQIPVVGTLCAGEEVVVSTKAAGILRRTFVDLGGEVKPGAPLAQADVLDYEVARTQAQASLAEVLARLGVQQVPDQAFDLTQVSAVQRSAAQLGSARFSYERLAQLGDAVASQELNDASARLRVAEAEHQLALDEAGALVAIARQRHAALEIAQRKLADALTTGPSIPTTLGATADHWVVAARLVTEGQYVNAADPLYRLVISNPLKLRCKIPEHYAAEVRAGLRTELENSAGRMAPAGQIARVSPSVDQASRTFEIEALIDNAADTYKPGAFVRGALVVESPAPAVYVPVDTLVTVGGRPRLFVVSAGVARQREVRTGRQVDGKVEIVAGLEAGEQVVIRGVAALADGAMVQVAGSSDAAAQAGPASSRK
jgi:RND family efflux transporter MFP subunit